jgi:hypothetical protein
MSNSDDSDNVVRVISGDRRRNSTLLMGSLMAGLIPGGMPKMTTFKEPHVRHQGEKERARRQKQKARMEAKAARRNRCKPT